MSKETLAWLNTNTLIGFTSKRDKAWHWREEHQGDESNSYPLAIPVEDVTRRLFHWKALTGPVETTILTEDGVLKVTDDERKVIVRSDTGVILGVFKSGYQVHDYNEWLINNVSTILDDSLSVSSAGLLKQGAVAWVEVSVPDTITTPEGFSFRPNLIAVTSLDGSLATTYKRTVQATVCDNTLSLALAEKGQQFKVKHSAKSLNRIAEARDALAIVHTITEEFAAQVTKLTSVSVSDQQWREFLEAHVPTKDLDEGRGLTLAKTKQSELNRLWKYDDRVSPWKNTAFGVLQASNTYSHHIQSVRGGDRVERNNLRAIDGTVDREDREVLDTLRKVLVSA